MAPPGRKCSSHTFLTFSILLVESKKRSQVLFCKLLQGIEVSTTLIVLQETHNLQPFSRFLAMNDTKPENHSRSTGVWRAKAYQAKSFRKGNGVYYCTLKKSSLWFKARLTITKPSLCFKVSPCLSRCSHFTNSTLATSGHTGFLQVARIAIPKTNQDTMRQEHKHEHHEDPNYPNISKPLNSIPELCQGT